MIRKVGIIGSGKMGSDIFNYLSDFNYELIWHILLEDEREKLQKSFIKKTKRQLKHGLIDQQAHDFKANFVLTSDFQDFSDCDLIIESIIEDIDIKREVYNELERIVKEDCILVSNSSSILPNSLSDSLVIYGMHFFYPVSFKNSVEIISLTESDKNLKNLIEFTESINKKVFKQFKAEAFLLNRFLLHLQVKSIEIIEKYKISIESIDEIGKQVVTDFGLFEMMDHVGHSTMLNSIKNYMEMESYGESAFNLLKILKSKISTRENLVNYVDIDVREEMTNAIKADLLNEVNLVIDKYIENYNLKSEELVSYLVDFCGLEL